MQLCCHGSVLTKRSFKTSHPLSSTKTKLLIHNANYSTIHNKMVNACQKPYRNNLLPTQADKNHTQRNQNRTNKFLSAVFLMQPDDPEES